MKRLLVLLSMLVCIEVLAKDNFIAKAEWDKPLEVTRNAFESITINYCYPHYYDAGYWEPNQAAGYFLVLALTGLHEGSWELSVDIQVTNGGSTTWKNFIFLVTPCYGYYHTHILDMIYQLAPGDTISPGAGLHIQHWWIVT